MKTIPYVLGLCILVVLAGAVGLAFTNKESSQQVTANNNIDILATTTDSSMASTSQAVTTATTTSSGSSVTATSTGGVSSLIHVKNPLSQQTIASGFVLSGEAKGNWYFEASFPAKLVDANGKTLTQFSVSANGDWMTTNFVPFSQTVTFVTPKTATGSLILQKDNPSGLSRNDAQIVIPVKFATSTSN